MANSLTWGGVLETPWFHVAEDIPGKLTIAEISFPHSSGRVPMILGGKQSESTSDQIIFAEEGDFRNRLVAAAQTTIVNMSNAIIVKMQSSSPLGTLAYTVGSHSRSLTNVQLVDFSLGPWERILSSGQADKVWQRTFRARFVRWH